MLKRAHVFKLFTIVLLVVSAGTLAGCRKRGGEAEPTPAPKKKISKPVNVIPFEERPYVVMSPTTNREVDVTVYRLPKAAASLDYLAEYQYGTSLGGNEQFIDLTDGLPGSKQFALYSRSAGGKTSYEEDVKGGTLTLDFSDPEEYRLEQEWAYYDRINPKSSTLQSDLVSKDKAFEISGNNLKPLRYVIIYNSPGSPSEQLPNALLSDIYTFAYAGTPTAGQVEVSVTTKAPAPSGASLYGWDGSAWEKIPSTVDSSQVTGTSNIFEAYGVFGS